jgi:uncharacterized protein (DUF58 family)
MYKRWIKPLFFPKKFYRFFIGLICLFIVAYMVPALFLPVKLLLVSFAGLTVIDYFLLYSRKNILQAERHCAPRFNNGDDNPVSIQLTSTISQPVTVNLIDEIPLEFPGMNFQAAMQLQPGESKEFTYSLRPVLRGEYRFYDINCFVRSRLGLVIRRVKVPTDHTVKVYPSLKDIRKYELQVHSDNLTDAGSRKMRKIGHSLEFEQIQDFVTGDDIRSINWKATARKGGQLMVNRFTDERSQQVYCIIDKGRVMKMPFDGMTLLDYAINATIILSRVALLKQDKAGLITFSEEIGQFIPADRKAGQMARILDSLYNATTRFLETDFEKLYGLLRTKVPQRSLIVLFTNFESMSGMQRQLPYIRRIARNHMLLLVFFENTGLAALTESSSGDIESLYIRTIAEKFINEKKQIVKELQQHGILSILCKPANLTIDTVNKYLEIKARQIV